MPTIDEFNHDTIELCLDFLSPSTLAALWHDHTNYIAKHQAETESEQFGDLEMLQQDADQILQVLADYHHHGFTEDAQRYVDKYDHIPF